MEGAAKWLATGPENQGFVMSDRGSIPPPSANMENAGAGSPSGLLNRSEAKVSMVRRHHSPPIAPFV